ncbi:protein of unknown function (DUF1992) [Balamuthia mandrillaris]
MLARRTIGSASRGGGGGGGGLLRAHPPPLLCSSSSLDPFLLARHERRRNGVRIWSFSAASSPSSSSCGYGSHAHGSHSEAPGVYEEQEAEVIPHSFAAETTTTSTTSSTIKIAALEGELKSEDNASSSSASSWWPRWKEEAEEEEEVGGRRPGSAAPQKGMVVAAMEKLGRAVRWMGPGGMFNYLRDVSSFPEDQRPIARRVYLKREDYMVPPKTPLTQREDHRWKRRAQKAKEDANNYAKSVDAKVEDFKRPTSLEEWGMVVEARIRQSMIDPVNGITSLPKEEEKEQDKKDPSGSLLRKQQDEEENPFVDRTTSIMHRLMKKNGCLPPWIELDKEIREGVEELDRLIQIEHQKWREENERTKRSVLKFRDSVEWSKFRRVTEDRVKTLNSKILHYNLIVPAITLQKFSLNLEWELDKLEIH